ncbi:nuclear transport factor 2 family protein [Mucilaginibacter phyllosphaerae]
MNYKESIIKSYINFYNNFDIDGMLGALDENIVFENVSNGEVNIVLNGIDEFRTQAEQSKSLFSNRRQTVTAVTDTDEQTTIKIAYHATLATDLPNGMKKGDELNLTGISVFKFAGDKIVYIRDES